MTSTRLRSLSGRPCRKTDVQICVSVSQFQNRVPGPSFGAMVFVSAIWVKPKSTSCLQERLRIGPLPELVLKVTALVDENLPVVGQHDARAFERARRRAL